MCYKDFDINVVFYDHVWPLHLLNVSNHRYFYRNRFIIERDRKKKRENPVISRLQIFKYFFVWCRRTYVLKNKERMCDVCMSENKLIRNYKIPISVKRIKLKSYCIVSFKKSKSVNLCNFRIKLCSWTFFLILKLEKDRRITFKKIVFFVIT